ncbi:MAG: S9 family peptidase [Bacteroidales bacterium]
MKNKVTAALLCFGALFSTLIAQNTEDNFLRDITSGKYASKGIKNLRSMADGEHYTSMNDQNNMIIKYSYRTGRAVDTLFNANTAKDCNFKNFSGYELSPEESKILLYKDIEPIYRHSFKANYFVYEIKRNKVKALSEGGKQQEATFAPNGKMVAFVRDNNLILAKLDYETESAITKDGKMNEIINGIPDWVYEEEFAFSRAFEWAPDCSHLAFIRFDETNVKEYSFDMYKGLDPAYPQYTLYPGALKYKYPKAGEENAKVSVHTYNIKTRDIKRMNVPLDADGYIPRIRFTEDANQLAVFTMNRHQNILNIHYVNPASGISKLVLKDESNYYINNDNLDMIRFYPDQIIFASEKSGNRQLYAYSHVGTLIKQITDGNEDVSNFLGYDPIKKSYFYEATDNGPLRRAIYMVDGKGKTNKLSQSSGWNSGSFSNSYKYFINNYSSATTPPLITVNDASGKNIRTLQDNADLVNKINNLANYSRKEFFTFKTSDGTVLNGWMMKPANFNPNKKYPVVMTQYSGPFSQQVKDQWSFGWEQALANQDFIISCVDGTGTGGRGEKFAKQTYLKLGQKEAHDQVEAASYLKTLSYVDANNIGIWGWSFGGYTTLMSMSVSKDIIKAGVAIAPVTDWRYYNTIYTERYMRTPQENKEGYDQGSPIFLANNFNGSLLLIHGTADDNVQYQNTTEYAEALVQANKQFDMQIYTNRNHSIFGGNTRYHLYTRVINFYKRELK